jgi:radical SAM protein with 4Fe4S-binding SPASM domain
VDAKKLLQNKSICVLPWTGFQLEPSGEVKNCIISKESIGNIADTKIKNIVHGEANTRLKEKMLSDLKPNNCSGCYLQEKHRADLSSISSRLYYLKEIGPKTDLKLLEQPKDFSLKHVDLRWTNSCNQACVYCGPGLSSKWAQELGVKVNSKKDVRKDVKEFVFENISNLQNVYLAGGEPMLMKENLEFLKLLKEKNPDCTIRVNTNLSTTQTGIFDLLVSFPNVHWTVSVETLEHEYEYIRHHGSWSDFEKNLTIIKKLKHKISFNMLHFILNYDSLFDCVDHFRGLGFHDNSFIIGPLYTPTHLNILNLPSPMIKKVVGKIKKLLDDKPEGYLKNSYENLLLYYTTTKWDRNIKDFIDKTKIRDARRGTDWSKVFPQLFEELNELE